MNKKKTYIGEDRIFVAFIIVILLASTNLITLGLSDNIIALQWLRNIFYDIGVGLLGTMITIVFVDRTIKQIEDKKAEKQMEKDKYDVWRNGFEQDIQTTSRNISNIKEMIDIILEMHNTDSKITDKSNISYLEDMLLIQIRLLSSNPPIREAFKEFDRIKVSKGLYETGKNLTAEYIVDELNNVFNTLANNLSSYKNNKTELKRIRTELSVAQIHFLKLKAKSFNDYNKEELT